ncbi:hypothetical protein [Aeromonas hydrophila]|nr:hypothetical protein [Aeromonas hydrophila]
MSTAQLQDELNALLGELDIIDLCPQERRALVDRIQLMMPDLAE